MDQKAMEMKSFLEKCGGDIVRGLCKQMGLDPSSVGEATVTEIETPESQLKPELPRPHNR